MSKIHEFRTLDKSNFYGNHTLAEDTRLQDHDGNTMALEAGETLEVLSGNGEFYQVRTLTDTTHKLVARALIHRMKIL